MILATLVFDSEAASVAEQVAALADRRSERLATDAPAPAASVYDKADRGDIVTGVTYVDGIPAGKGWAVAVLDRPVEQLWAAVLAEDRYAGRFGLSTSVILDGDVTSVRHVFQVVDLPMIVSDRWCIGAERANGKLYSDSNHKLWELAWDDATQRSRLDGTSYGDEADAAVPVAWSKGAWLLLPLDDGRTVVEYFSWSDPGGSLPAGAASRFASGAMSSAMKDLDALAGELSGARDSSWVRPDGSSL